MRCDSAHLPFTAAAAPAAAPSADDAEFEYAPGAERNALSAPPIPAKVPLTAAARGAKSIGVLGAIAPAPFALPAALRDFAQSLTCLWQKPKEEELTSDLNAETSMLSLRQFLPGFPFRL